ncbi:MAG: N-acetyltransferase [Candidatus Viridilinea halotolerans]|uniref:N-acetyltransferase n=1 Tax=Candidatus Viridilinea halotolerans TaxID=2491704 RepID=A0A426U5V6_9CHLR|nr:MAG: N-acetyltransferase [Candidatus Viridilinea halotolerans]
MHDLPHHPSPPRLCDIAPTELLSIIETSFVRSWLPFAHIPGAALHDAPDLLWFSTGQPDAFLNAVLRTQLAPDEADVTIQTMVATFRSRMLPLSWYVGPAARPTDLVGRLLTAGFRHVDTMVGMAINLHTRAPTRPEIPDLHMVEVNNAATLQQWFTVFQAGFGMSHAMRVAYEAVCAADDSADSADTKYLGYVAGFPVACLTLTREEAVASLYDVATIPAARRRGIGSAMVRAALEAARTAAYQTAILLATAEGAGMYRRVGFQDYGQLGHYVLDP